MKQAREYSAGGVVLKGGKVLLIRMKTLKGELVWTYPKGHVEDGETPSAAALREVFEETGWECEIVERMQRVRYTFSRKGRRVRKQVQWYRMRPLRRSGRPDPVEIFGLSWLAPGAARRRLKYPADFRVLDRARRAR